MRKYIRISNRRIQQRPKTEDREGLLLRSNGNKPARHWMSLRIHQCLQTPRSTTGWCVVKQNLRRSSESSAHGAPNHHRVEIDPICFRKLVNRDAGIKVNESSY